jgi:hypothetical protein
LIEEEEEEEEEEERKRINKGGMQMCSSHV